MTEPQAAHFAEFIKDHDKRFEAKARPDGDSSAVLLTLAADGTALEPIVDIAEYQHALIDRDDPGPTVRAAWESWSAKQQGQAHGG